MKSLGSGWENLKIQMALKGLITGAGGINRYFQITRSISTNRARSFFTVDEGCLLNADFPLSSIWLVSLMSTISPNPGLHLLLFVLLIASLPKIPTYAPLNIAIVCSCNSAGSLHAFRNPLCRTFLHHQLDIGQVLSVDDQIVCYFRLVVVRHRYHKSWGG